MRIFGDSGSSINIRILMIQGVSINMRIFGDSESFIDKRILMIQGVSINMRKFGDSGGFNKYENTYSGGLSLCHTL